MSVCLKCYHLVDGDGDDVVGLTLGRGGFDCHLSLPSFFGL